MPERDAGHAETTTNGGICAVMDCPKCKQHTFEWKYSRGYLRYIKVCSSCGYEDVVIRSVKA